MVTFILVEKNEQKREDGTKCCRQKGECMPRPRKEKELSDTQPILIQWGLHLVLLSVPGPRVFSLDPEPTWVQGDERPCCRWLYSVSSSHCSCAVLLGFWLDIIPNTSTWLGSRGADRKRSSSKSDTRGAFTIHLQPARMSSLRMSLRSTSGQS